MRAGDNIQRPGGGGGSSRRLWPSFIAIAVLTAVALILIGQSQSGGASLVVRKGTIRVLATDTIAGDGSGRIDAKRGRSQDVYTAVLDGDDGHLYFLSGRPRFPNGKHVRVAGTLANSKLTVETLAPTTVAPTASAMPTSGTTKVLVMLAYWTQPDSVTPESAATQMFTDSNAWYQDNSYGALGQTGVVTPWMRITAPTSNLCYANSGETMNRAKSSAQALGYDLTSFDNFVVYFPYDGESGSDCGDFAGWAVVGSDGTWLNGYMDRRVTVHEQGHNYGLWHAHSLLCAGSIDASCQFSEYGHDYDAMGSSNYVGHFSASQKEKLGWLPGRLRDLTAGGSATLVPYETDAPATVAAVVRASPQRSYWLEYRQPQDFDRDLPSAGTDGLIVSLQDPTVAQVGDDSASILDTRPRDGLSASSATLRAGESWVSDEGILFRVGSASTTDATVTVSYPGTGTVTGVVRDANGMPLRGAVVQLVGESVSPATTDTAGRYTLPRVLAGDHAIETQHICRSPQQTALTTIAGSNTLDVTVPSPAAAPCSLDTPAWDAPTEVLALTGDDASVSVALPFSYAHFGKRYSTAHVSTNGTVNFLAPSTAFSNTALPDPAEPNAAIDAFWDDLNVDGSAQVVTGTFGAARNRRFVVEWRNVTFYAEPDRRLTVQAVLYENPGTRLRLQYRDIDQATVESGRDATIGVENKNGTVARQVAYQAGLLYDGLAIRIPAEAAVVNVPMSAEEERRLGEISAWLNMNRDDALKFGVQALAFLAAVDTGSPTPWTIASAGSSPTVHRIAWNPDELATLREVQRHWVMNRKQAHRGGFYVLSYILAVNGG